jgi:hypothetical protein
MSGETRSPRVRSKKRLFLRKKKSTSVDTQAVKCLNYLLRVKPRLAVYSLLALYLWIVIGGSYCLYNDPSAMTCFEGFGWLLM